MFRVFVVGAAAVLAFLARPTVAGDKYVIDKSRPMDDAQRPAAGKALIYFVRMDFGAVKVKLYGDGRFLGIVADNTFIPYECDPGKHEFIGHTEKAAFLEAEVAPDKIYYVEVSIHAGFAKGRTHFEVVRPGTEPWEDLLEAHATLRAVTTTEEGMEWITEEAADVAKDIERGRQTRDEFAALTPADGLDAPPWVRAK